MDSAETAPVLTVDDELLAELRNTNAVVATLVESLARTGGQVQNQQVSNDMGGLWIVASLAASIASILLVLGFMILENRTYSELSRKTDNSVGQLRAELSPQVDQLRAWNDVHSKEIARLQAGQEKH